MSQFIAPSQTATIRPKVARLTVKLLTPFVEEGIITVAELNKVRRGLKSLAATGANAPAIEPRLLTQAETATLLGLSLSNFKHQEALGNIAIPRKVIGGAVRYRNLDVYAFMSPLVSDCQQNNDPPEVMQP